MRASLIGALLGGGVLIGGLWWGAPTIARPGPAPPNGPGQVRFAVIGDYGTGGQAEADVAALVHSWSPEFIITTGDNNYPDGAASTIDPNIGQYYHDFIAPYTGSYGVGAASNAFFPALGNHDWVTAGAAPYLAFFTLPGNERYYDLVRGPVHFFAIDSDPSEPDGIGSASVQAQWLQAGLAAAGEPWKLVYMHHPPYSSGPHGPTAALQWPYQQWGASAVLAGHDHDYERLLVGGLPYFVDGAGGQSLYTIGAPIAGSVVQYDADYGALFVTADSNAITFEFTTRTGNLIDSYTITAPTATLTRTPTSTPALTATPTRTPTRTPTPTVTPTSCAPAPAVPVSWINLVKVATTPGPTANTIQKTSAALSWDAGAVSSQQIAAGNGYVEATVAYTTTFVMFGLSTGDANQTYQDIDYALYTYGSSNRALVIYEAGTYRGMFGSYDVGDVLRVAVCGGVVSYYRNNTLLYTSTRPPVYPLLLDSAIYSPTTGQVLNAQIAGAGTPLGATNTPTATATATPTGAVPTVTAAPGAQLVTAWQNATNVAITGNTITKNAGGLAWNAGASSVLAIPAGAGYVEATVADETKFVMFGLNRDDQIRDYTEIDYAWYMYGSTKTLYIYENATNRGSFGPYHTGDVLRVALVGGQVRYYQNGLLRYTSALAPVYPQRLDSSIYSTGGSVQNALIAGAGP